MAISSSSRYASSTVVSLSKDGQVVNVIVPSKQTATTFTYVSHMVTDTDRLDHLAYQYYGDPTQWFIIANANPEIIDWSALVPGSIIRVPFS